MRLHTLTFEVGDWKTVERCRDWYVRHLGLVFSHELEGESVWFDVDQLTVGFHTGKGPDSAVTLSFEVEDVESVVERMRSEGLEITDVAQKRWGGRIAYTRDPAGHLVGVATMDQAPATST